MSKLFQPMKVGASQLGNRLVLAPLTRYRADEEWVPLPFVAEYYAQRAAVPGTLLITEATFTSKRTTANRYTPGIWSEAQIAAWKKVTDAVHEKGCPIYCQLWNQGRAGKPEVLESVGGRLLAPSAVAMNETKPTPEEMTEQDIWDAIHDFAQAAKNAIAAGFDGVEIHAANGYLGDQFLQDVSNKRTDSWGGSIPNRAKFVTELTKAVSNAIGADRTGVRLSPFSDFQNMLMDDPIPTFDYVVRQLKPMGLAYVHLVEARITGNDDSKCGGENTVMPFVKTLENQVPVIIAGGFKPDTARQLVEEYKDYDIAIGFGRYFISNPDLVFRVREGLELTKYDRSTFYIPKEPKGYLDYPYSPEYIAQQPNGTTSNL